MKLVEPWTGNRRVASSRITAGSHCVVPLSKTLLSIGSTQEDRKFSDIAEKLLTGM